MMKQFTDLTNISADSKIDYSKNWSYFKNTNKLILTKNGKQYPLKNIFNYITQAVNVDIALLTKGLKVIADNKDFAEILNAIYKNIRKDLFSMYLAVYGNSYLKMELDEEKQLIKLKVLQSPNVDFTKDADGNILQATYTYLQKDTEGNSVSIKEIYTAEKIQRYIDGKLVEEKGNKFGFVPLYHFMFTDTGEKFGVNSFDHIAIQQDVVNVYANMMFEVGEKMIEPIYLIKTGEKLTEKERQELSLQFAKNIFEGINVLVTTSDGGAEIIEGGMANTDKALDFLDKIQQNIEQNLPELLLTKLADKDASGYALNMMLLGLQTKIEGARENIQKELRKVNKDIYKVLVSWGKLPSSAENYTEIKFDEVFDFMKSEKLAEVKQELDMGLITEDIARQKLGIEWSGTEKGTTSNGETSASTKTINKAEDKKGFIRKIVDKVKNVFGADK